MGSLGYLSSFLACRLERVLSLVNAQRNSISQRRWRVPRDYYRFLARQQQTTSVVVTGIVRAKPDMLAGAVSSGQIPEQAGVASDRGILLHASKRSHVVFLIISAAAEAMGWHAATTRGSLAGAFCANTIRHSNQHGCPSMAMSSASLQTKGVHSQSSTMPD